MKTTERRQPTHRPSLFDGDKPSTAVPLQDDSWCIVDTMDYRRLVEDEDYPDQWYTSFNRLQVPYVRLRIPGEGRCVAVSRLIVGAMPGEKVIHRNGDTLDLRRANLIRVTLRRLRNPLTVY